MYKKLLVISHNCFSQSGSNGRTLSNYLIGWPKEKIAQMYIHAETPDFEMCNQYFCVTDSNIVKSIIKRRDAGACVIQREEASTKQKSRRIPKNSLVYIMRELAWKSKLWKRAALLEWIDKYQPEVLLFQAGDAAFLFEFVIEISQRYKIPIILYNTEGYYFKKESYLQENAVSRMFYPILHKGFVKSYRKLMKCKPYAIYNCELLKNDYSKAFDHECAVIMNGSRLVQIEPEKNKKQTIVYAGNLGVGRTEALLEFSEALNMIDDNLYIDVYGKANEKILDDLKKGKRIRYQGFVNYEEVAEIIGKSEYLLHIENFEAFYRRDLKYAFSTKIADSLATGACLIVFAPEEVAVCQYLENKEAALVINQQSDLEERLKLFMENDELRERIKKNARELAISNHNIEKNRRMFQKIIIEQER